MAVVAATEDTGDTGLLAAMENEGINTTGISVESEVDTNVDFTSSEGVTILVKVQTDGHPSKLCLKVSTSTLILFSLNISS